MSKIKSILFVFLVMFYVGCSKKDNKGYHIDSYEKDPIHFFKKIELIPLETLDESLLGEIKKIKITKNKIYILDTKQKTVFVFSSKGKFLNKICKVGQGQGEYVRLLDFDVFPNGNIELLTGDKLLCYDETGNFKKEIKLPALATHFFHRINNENTVLYHLAENRRVSIFNEKTLTHSYYGKEVPPYNNKLPVNPWRSPFFETGGNIYLKDAFTNDIFKVTPQGLNKEFTFFKDYPLHLTDLPKGKNITFYVDYIRNLKTPKVTRAFFNDKYNIALFSLGRKGSALLIYDKKEKKEHFMNSFYGGQYSGVYFQDNMSFGLLEYDQLKTYKNQPIRDKINCNIDSLLQNLDEYSNPTLIKYYFN